MQLNHKVHLQADLNGGRHMMQSTEAQSFQSQILDMMKWVMTLDVSPADFSTLNIRISKRPILDESDEWDKFLTEHQTHVSQVCDLDTLEGFPDITWAEYGELQTNPTFTEAMRLKRGNRQDFTEQEMTAIKEFWQTEFRGTKFYKLIGDL